MRYTTIYDSSFIFCHKIRWLAINDVESWGKGTLAQIPIEAYDKIVNGNR